MRRNLILPFAALAALLGAPLAEARDIFGAMSYRERIALPEGAALKVELRGPEGIVAEATIDTEGRQVPLPFVVVAPDTGDYSLQGAIVVGGRVEWVSQVVPVAAGEDALDLGAVALKRHVALGQLSRMRCGDRQVGIGFSEQGARLRVGGEVFDLAPAISGSGARYSDGADPETVVWSKGNAALVTVRGEDLPECAPMIEPPLLPLTARGNEPFWRLDLTEAGFVYEANMGQTRQEGALPQPVATAEGLRFDLSDTLSVEITRALCRDSMSGMPHPLQVVLTEGGEALSGCAGAPVDLLAGAWTVEHVEGAVLPEGAEVSMLFDATAGRVFGKSACNRYNGGFTLTGEGLIFGPAAGTMMACPSDLMAVEQTFLRALETVDRFDLAEDGALELVSGATVVVRARR